MAEVPECLSRRYQAIDDLIDSLNSKKQHPSLIRSSSNTNTRQNDDMGIKLMCDFWSIIKENPDCDLAEVVKERITMAPSSCSIGQGQQIQCYMSETSNKQTHGCLKGSPSNKSTAAASSCPHKDAPQQSQSPNTCHSSKSSMGNNASSALTKVLCSLNDAATYDMKCNERLNALMETEKKLREQIQCLEGREKEGQQRIKKAETMWSRMEESYKKKIADSQERICCLSTQCLEIENSTSKWRGTKKELESQLDSIGKCFAEIKEKIQKKTNDIKYIEADIESIKKKLANTKKDTESAKASITNKKYNSDEKIKKIHNEIFRIQQEVTDEKKTKAQKDNEGTQQTKKAREELARINKLIMEESLEIEDLKAKEAAMITDLAILTESVAMCKDKCQDKEAAIVEEINTIDKEIADYDVKCIRCHACCSTSDIRKLCTDCPRCVENRKCLVEDDHCSTDSKMNCVCMTVKHKFLDNVFDNMYTVLERQAQHSSGKTVADSILSCLKNSKNGKLDARTRKLLQDFVLAGIKKDLNLTIVGGAVKTRCELEQETYNQLMLCLKQVKVEPVQKVDKAIPTKKVSCKRWGGCTECNCPKGPDRCVCSSKAASLPDDPIKRSKSPSASKTKLDSRKESGGKKESSCCGHGLANGVGTEVMESPPSPNSARKSSCSRNMRAAQCVLGPESLAALKFGPGCSSGISKEKCARSPHLTTNDVLYDDRISHSRDRIIEEVLGKHSEVQSIYKVSSESTEIADESDGINF